MTIGTSMKAKKSRGAKKMSGGGDAARFRLLSFRTERRAVMGRLGEGRGRTSRSSQKCDRGQDGPVAAHGDSLHCAYDRLARLAESEPGALRDASLALPREHQGKSHCITRRVRKDIH